MASTSPTAAEAILGLAAALFAFLLLRSRRRERLAEERFQELDNLAHAFAEASEVQAIAACAHDAAARMSSLDRFELYFFDEQDRVREVWSSPPEDPLAAPRPSVGHPNLAVGFQRERLDGLTRTDTAHSFAPRHLQSPQRGQKKFYLPLFSGSQPVGYWELEYGSPLVKSELERLRAVYRYLTDAVNSERNFRLAARDGLSGLYVRRYFDARLREEVLRAERYRRSLSLAAFDLDHFKNLNDRYGHPAGDEAIRRFARTLQAGIREQDVCGRRGGEEFSAFFPETRSDSALGVCERIRARLADEPLSWNEKKISLTVSVGVTDYREGDDLESILQRADSALYEAKRQGRNRAIVIA